MLSSIKMTFNSGDNRDGVERLLTLHPATAPHAETLAPALTAVTDTDAISVDVPPNFRIEDNVIYFSGGHVEREVLILYHGERVAYAYKYSGKATAVLHNTFAPDEVDAVIETCALIRQRTEIVVDCGGAKRLVSVIMTPQVAVVAHSDHRATATWVNRLTDLVEVVDAIDEDDVLTLHATLEDAMRRVLEVSDAG